MMKGRVDSKMLSGFGLLVVLIYCLVRALGALAAGPESAVNEAANASPGELALLVQGLKQNIAEIIVSKHRNGPVGSVELVFRTSLAKFENAATRSFDITPEPEAEST